jgi:hypothetical protein
MIDHALFFVDMTICSFFFTNRHTRQNLGNVKAIRLPKAEWRQTTMSSAQARMGKDCLWTMRLPLEGTTQLRTINNLACVNSMSRVVQQRKGLFAINQNPFGLFSSLINDE